MKKKISRLVALCMIFVMCISNTNCIAVADDSAEVTTLVEHLMEVPDGYVGIYTKEDLDNVRKDLTASYILMNDIEFSKTDFEEGGSFYNEGKGWKSIGNFRGTFEGNGYAIKNLLIQNEGIKGETDVGLFSNIINATIENLNVLNSQISVFGNSWIYVGGIVGDSYNSTISGCNVSGTIKAGTNNSSCGAYVGGLVGGGGVYIDGCVNYANVYGIGENVYAAGIVGSANDSKSEFNNLINYGRICSEANSAGIVGFMHHCKISGCVNYGAIESNNEQQGNGEVLSAAGIVGGGDTIEVIFCSNSAKINASTSYKVSTNASGVCGGIGEKSVVSGCSNFGEISSVGKGDASSGGIVGTGYFSEINNCYNSGNVISKSPELSYSGGVAAFGQDVIFVNSYNIGEVATAEMLNNSYCGGILGYSYESSLHNCLYLENGINGVGTEGYYIPPSSQEEMQQIDTYKGFDFENIWVMQEYPALRNSKVCTHELIVIEPKDSTCKSNGRMLYRKCYRCNQAFMYDCDIPVPESAMSITKLPHSIVVDAEVLPDCINDGLSIGQHCSVCNEIIIKQEVLTARGHTEVTITGKDGCKLTEGKQCSVCGEVTVPLTPTGEFQHTEVTITGKDGCKLTEGKQCSVCGEVTMPLQPTGELQHEKVTETKVATMDKDGSIVTKCKNCGEIFSTNTIPKISRVTLSATKYVYSGSTKKPTVTVKDEDGNTLVNGTDYTLPTSYGKKSVGRYAVTITYKGKYSGSKTLYFTIVPKAPSSASANLSSASQTSGYDDVKFTWKASTGASGYLVYYKKGSGSWSSAVATTGTSYTKKNLTDGVKYTFKVVPYYKTSSGATKYYSTEQYKTASVYTLKKVSTPTVTKSGTKVKVKWTNISGETGYQISRSTSKTGTNIVSTYATTSGTYKTVSATKGKTYYYKVRAYKIVDGKKIYGPWSEVVKYKR